MKKRMVSILLSLTVLGSCVMGCGSSAEPSSSTGSNEAKTTEISDGKVALADSSDSGVITSKFTDIEGNEVEIQTGVQFPLEEEVTLTFWYPVGWNFVGEMSALQEGEVWQYLKDMTNVSVEFIHPAEGTEEESYSLLYASDKLPDILYSNLQRFCIHFLYKNLHKKNKYKFLCPLL